MRTKILAISLFLFLWQGAICQENISTRNGAVEFSQYKPLPDSKALEDYYWHNASRGYPVFLSTNGSVVNIGEPTFLIEASADQVPYLIYPNEKIEVEDHKTCLYFFVTGNDQRTNELQFFRKLVTLTGNIYKSAFNPPVDYTTKVNSIASLKQSEKTIFNICRKRMSILDSCKINDSLSDSFVSVATEFIQCKALQDTLNLYFANKALLEKNGVYTKTLEELIQSFQKIQFMPFQFYYRLCQDFLAITAFGNPNYVLKNMQDFEKSFHIAMNFFNGAAKDYALFFSVNRMVSGLPSLDEKYIEIFYNECNNSKYKSVIREKILRQNVREAIESKDLILPLGANKAEDVQKLIEKNRGKIILLDFWASWCAPCRAEMPYSKSLVSQYSMDEIVCIYLSLDEEESEWVRAVRELGLDENLNYRFANGNSDFIKHFNFTGIPRYMIIDKQGKVVQADAPRPSDSRLKDLLDKYLKEK